MWIKLFSQLEILSILGCLKLLKDNYSVWKIQHMLLHFSGYTLMIAPYPSQLSSKRLSVFECILWSTESNVNNFKKSVATGCISLLFLVEGIFPCLTECWHLFTGATTDK